MSIPKLLLYYFITLLLISSYHSAHAAELSTSTPTTTDQINPVITEPWTKYESIHAIDNNINNYYYLNNGQNNFSIYIKKETSAQNLNLVLRELGYNWIPTGPTIDEKGNQTNLERISFAYEYDFISDQKIRPFALPITLNFKTDILYDIHGNTDMRRKIIHYWDKGRGVWRPLPTVTDLAHNIAAARTYLPYSILAVFMAQNEFDAYASWYPDSLTPSSKYNGASNNYKIGTYVKVCRLDNLAKCVKIKIVSTGPYVDNRIVDLTKTAFQTIGNPGGGIVGVRVIPVK
ncbi:MAG TPA: RlpA-like double-psi beta-barrel domain-containing protein [bacterium]|nr:RlpA-like double-psi beta-barrel domain-containing protein [bacterium]HPL95369.1 RlpA-like double-psi beta-barrel domain-containing protein [bacterium]